MAIVALDYIEVDDRGVARLIGTRTKVRQVVMDVQNGMSPEQIHSEYPHLSMAQIHAALAYYYDHRVVIDDEIERGVRLADEMRAANPNRFTRAEYEARWRERFGTEPPSPEAGD